MRWSVPVDRKVADAVIATFSDSAERSYLRLTALQLRDWERSYRWLVASGMALYFLDRLQTLRIESALPAAMIGRLQQNLSDHRKRSAFMRAEFIAVNRAFLRAGVRYCNLKGFTLAPDYCPDPALRSQMDLDFLVDGKQLDVCRHVLNELGYTQTTETRNEWEFKASSSEMISIEDHFKPRLQRTIELHFSTTSKPPYGPSCDERLNRLAQREWDGYRFPVFMPEDQFVGQALHLLQHLRSPSTRLSWLLEYKRFVSAHDDDRHLWDKVRECSKMYREAYIAIGLASALSNQIFGGSSPAQLDKWTLDRLPANVRLWTSCFGHKTLLAGPPGTKLYLLLEAELACDDGEWRRRKRNRLLPVYSRAARIACPSANEGLRKRIRRELYQIRFILFRIRFHIVEDIHYLIESRRWHRFLAAQCRPSSAGSKEPGSERELSSIVEYVD